jgi:AraC-like DNA-binding protein
MTLNLLSFFVGLILIILPYTVLINQKKWENVNYLFLLILAIAGIKRIAHGFEYFNLLESFSNPFRTRLLFSLFLPPIYYLFFQNLLYNKINNKGLIPHLILPTIIIIFSKFLDFFKFISPTIFIIYTSFYMLLCLIITLKYIYTKKNFKETIHYNSIKNWAFIMFVIILINYLFPNYLLIINSVEAKNDILDQFYNFTSLIWLFIVIYLLKNPAILHGEAIFIKIINKSSIEDIEIWQKNKIYITDKEDIEIEKKLKNNIDKIIFSIKAYEIELLQNFSHLPSLKEFSFKLEYPQSHVKYIFKYFSYLSYSEYQNVLKVKYAMKLIKDGYLETRTIESMSVKCHFTSRSAFYRNFKKLTGYSPYEYQADTSSFFPRKNS